MFAPYDACAYLVPLQQVVHGTIKKLLRVHPMRSAMLWQLATHDSRPSELHLCWLESVLVPIRPESGLMMIRTKLCFDKRRGASTRATQKLERCFVSHRFAFLAGVVLVLSTALNQAGANLQRNGLLAVAVARSQALGTCAMVAHNRVVTTCPTQVGN